MPGLVRVANAVAGAAALSQRPCRDVRSHEARQHQHGMAVAVRRQAKQRQGAEEGAELVKGAPLQQHQGL